MRYLYVVGGVVVNVVEYSVTPPEVDEDGTNIILAITGVENIGDTIDITDVLKERRISKMETVIFQELFRLTNDVRILKGQATITVNQYKTFIKSLM